MSRSRGLRATCTTVALLVFVTASACRRDGFLCATCPECAPPAVAGPTVVVPEVVASRQATSEPSHEQRRDLDVEEAAPPAAAVPLPNGRVRDADEYFATLDHRFQASAAKDLHAVFQFELSGPHPCAYHVAVDDGVMKLETGHASKADVTIAASSEDYVRVVNGELGGVGAVMARKMKVDGDLTLARRMKKIFPPGRADN